MFKDSKAFSGFSVNDTDAAKQFYAETLGVAIKDDAMGLMLDIPGSNGVFIYQKDDHRPASFTILNFPVQNIDEAVEAMSAKGIEFERYEGMEQDEKGIMRGIAAKMGPDIAWFKDPAGNILAVLQN